MIILRICTSYKNKLNYTVADLETYSTNVGMLEMLVPLSVFSLYINNIIFIKIKIKFNLCNYKISLKI